MAFSVSECCYRYERRLSNENMLVAELLLGLTQSQRNWGIGLCFLYLRNVKGYRWNHKRVYRIYRELDVECQHVVHPPSLEAGGFLPRAECGRKKLYRCVHIDR